jgi:hypothetical protein
MATPIDRRQSFALQPAGLASTPAQHKTERPKTIVFI